MVIYENVLRGKELATCRNIVVGLDWASIVFVFWSKIRLYS